MKAVIVQARMGSTRLPGKILKKLAGETVLSHVLRRCGQIEGIDTVCCAVPNSANSDSVAEEAIRCGAVVFRGSEHDVLNRYYKAALALDACFIMRVTSDCPLIDPDICAEVLWTLLRFNADYACNNRPRRWPLGLDCEAFTIAALARADARSSALREHVTPYLRTHPEILRMSTIGPGVKGRWTLDYPEDLAFFEALFEKIDRDAGFEDVQRVLQAHPEIVAINEGRYEPAA